MNIKKYFFAAACMALLFFALNAAVFCGVANAAAGDKGKRVLVVYYSYSKDGNTRKVARRIHELAGGDIVEIKPVKPYQGAYDEVVRQAQEENAVDYRAPISTKVSDIRSYDVVFVGTPVWWPCMTFAARRSCRSALTEDMAEAKSPRRRRNLPRARRSSRGSRWTARTREIPSATCRRG